jgi:hypothetical protein
MNQYTCYHLNIASDLALPELTPARFTTPDLIICRGHISDTGLADGNIIGPFLQAAPQRLWLKVPEVARYLIKNGNEIIYDPAPGIDEASIRVFLLGSGLGALLFQRGYLVLHGNAFQFNNHCVICTGHSGAGKSTLAAAIMQRGYSILADDVCPVDAHGQALPGMPRIKLWQDSADKLAISTTHLERIRPEFQKYNYPLGDTHCTEKRPVKLIYILHTQDDEDGFQTEPVTGLYKFNPLKNQTYRFNYLTGMMLDQKHLAWVSQLAARVQVIHLYRPRGSFQIQKLTDFILEDITQRERHP